MIGSLVHYKGGEISTETFSVRDSQLPKAYLSCFLMTLDREEGTVFPGRSLTLVRSYTASILYGHLAVPQEIPL